MCNKPQLLDIDQLRARSGEYREKYRLWRLGNADGSAGEVSDITNPNKTSQKSGMHHRASVGILFADEVAKVQATWKGVDPAVSSQQEGPQGSPLTPSGMSHTLSPLTLAGTLPAQIPSLSLTRPSPDAIPHPSRSLVSNTPRRPALPWPATPESAILPPSAGLLPMPSPLLSPPSQPGSPSMGRTAQTTLERSQARRRSMEPTFNTTVKPLPLVVHNVDGVEGGSRGLERVSEGDKAGRVLLIYTGGTLGMSKLPNGSLAPKKGYLPACIKAMPEVLDESMPDLDIIEYDPLLDSSNVTPVEWMQLVSEIQQHYYDYDGFVIIHGTDTMAYTASALSFMLEYLAKPVIITGSMIPLADFYNDARRNLLISIAFAAQLELCEVAIFFNDKLLRGNRAIKIDSNGLSAFDSPNFPPLATVGASISIERSVWKAPPARRLRVRTQLDASVVVLHLVPGFDDSPMLAMIRHAPNLKGMILSLYGTGNGPSGKRSFLKAITEAINRGILVVIATQCLKGEVSLSTYEVGQKLLDIGVISAGDMTTEACSTKMAYLFGRELTGQELSDAMQSDLRGELTLKGFSRAKNDWSDLSRGRLLVHAGGGN